MKILQVINAFNPEMGGPVTICYNLSKELVKAGHDVTIITSDYRFNKSYARSLSGIEIIPFKVVANIGLFLISPDMNTWLKSHIRDYDIIHLHELQSYQNNIVFSHAKKANVPYILHAHGLAPKIMEKSFLKRLYNYVWGDDILKNASKVIALTEMESIEYQEMGVPEKKIVIVPNGLDLSVVKHLPDKGLFRKKIGYNADEKIILYLGRLNETKGIHLLIDAFGQILPQMADARLVIVGPDDGYLQHLIIKISQMGISDRVLIVGPVSETEKFTAYMDADICVLPSIYEPFGITVLEAWACGVPVIVTKGCGIADVVKSAGLVVDYNKEQMASAILQLLKNEELRKKFGESGKKFVNEVYDYDNIWKQIEVVYLECCKAVPDYGGKFENPGTIITNE